LAQEPYHLVAVDDQESILEALKRALGPRGFYVDTFTDPKAALAMLAESGDRVDVLVTDVGMPGLDGLALLEAVREFLPDLPVAMLTGDKSAKSAVKALSAGAFTYLTKPVQSFDAAAAVLRGAASHRHLQRKVRALQAQVANDKGPTIIAGKGPMTELLDTVRRVAKLDVSVLLHGESGTGKELVARALHDMSNRASGPFVAVNCAAIPEGLVDSELFGHVRGAFTGAVEPRAGVFERASGGTLFLDEIGDLAPAVQARLLRVLQERQVCRVGGSKSVAVDLRLIAATLVDLPEAVEKGDFRADLYYRLDVVKLELPPLRSRRDDIPLLASHLLEKHTARLQCPGNQLNSETMDRLKAYDWPGNVRELENIIQRILALSTSGDIGPELLPKRFHGLHGLAPLNPAPKGDDSQGDPLSWTEDMSFSDARKQAQIDFERAYMARLLECCQGNISAAARSAGLDRSNLRRILTRVGLKEAE
jgi:two-component system response regulator HydG